VSPAAWPGPHVWTRDPLVVFDTETTGLDPRNGHRVVELALVRAERLRPVRALATLLNPGREALEAFRGSRAAEANRIDPAELERAPRLWEIAGDVRNFVGELPLMAYNAPFDVKFLRAELLEILGSDALPRGLWREDDALDPLVWVRDADRFVRAAPYRARGLKRHCLAAAAERRGLAPEGELHRAETDARLLLDLARTLARERSIGGWTVRLLRRQAARRAAQDAERRAYYERRRV